MSKTLLIIITDRLTDLLKKGEITDRYYNPENVFDNVHILSPTGAAVDMDVLQRTVGNAKLHLHSFPWGPALFVKTLCWTPALLKGWAQQGVELAKEIKPDLIRCHGNFINGFMASEIKKELGIPFVVSIHIHPDEMRREIQHGWKTLLYYNASKRVEDITLDHADVAILVYKSQLTYKALKRCKRVEQIYNVINPKNIGKKTNYKQTGENLKVVTVTRLVPGRNPENILRAVDGEKIDLTIIGDGPYLQQLKDIAANISGPATVEFITALPNEKLCTMLPEFDVFAMHTEYDGIHKTALEASLAGLPLVVNKRKHGIVPEFKGDWLLSCENTPEGFREQLRSYMDENVRKSYGQKAAAHSKVNWDPEYSEKRYADVYREFLK